MASKIPIFGGIAAAAGITVFVLFFTPAGISQEEYSLSVDPTKEKQQAPPVNRGAPKKENRK